MPTAVSRYTAALRRAKGPRIAVARDDRRFRAVNHAVNGVRRRRGSRARNERASLPAPSAGEVRNEATEVSDSRVLVYARFQIERH